ncbi:thioredoxin-dependent thiol peroxidase [Chryseobacterium koreense]|uniref:thioredoxin-dependent peroxiredoxin n=1 Tax=Chryseobacterium koreense CCUG 49689 TaxID=1304281 RepID=A0A0J7IZR6_9FLAO|nr:thioredoxin-dependent thiol peroxidase [Chryseobacterium koreense]KMQ71321.1 thiol peroxidase [Chryseobacterium koreense CCUG 49689]MBB5333927.1 peroxiredoxin Q/BCP [Chryseobacterium koreense]
MLKIGDQLPDFELQNQDGKTIKSSQLLGKKLVIFFYPKANTPTCTVEACNINDHISGLRKAGFQLLGISADSVKRQKNFHEKFGFKYDLLSDENHEVIEKFGVWQEKNTFGKTYMGIVRTTFLFDEKGICTRVISDVKSKIAAEQILESA